jgi:membrane-bound serine protease (ClpP class)
MRKKSTMPAALAGAAPGVILALTILCAGILVTSGVLRAEGSKHVAEGPKSVAEGPKSVLVVKIDGVINPVVSEFIEHSILNANEEGCEALVVELDTPGGLDTSMRAIIKDINHSNVPVVVYVHPSSARAASAGVLITMAAHVAAMTPGTNIGAAHPVSMGGAPMDKTMTEKVTNDSVAYIKSIAERRGRNVQWAEDAVRKSVSVTDKEALELHIIDLTAANLDELLQRIDGREIKLETKTVTLKTGGARQIRREMGMRLNLLNVISDPNIAYILMMLGFYGLFFELTNPGAVFPGIVGGISLILAFYALQTLSVNYAGVLLILLALILFILEIKIISHGLLTLGGIVSMTLGSLMLFKEASPFLQLSIYLVALSVIMTAIFFTVIIGLAYKAWRRKPVSGVDSLVGLTGIAHTDVYNDGMVRVHGELWSAQSDEFIAKGREVIVAEIQGLKMKVRLKPSN